MLRCVLVIGALGVGVYPQVLSCAEARPSETAVRAQGAAHARLVQTLDVCVPYGSDEGSLGFVPAGDEHEALGPNAFEVRRGGEIVVADIARRKIFSVRAQRDGRTVVAVVSTLGSRQELAPGAGAGGARAVKTGAETGAIVFGSGADERRVAIEAGGPLASLGVIGVDGEGRAFVLVERFRKLGRTEVDREVVIVDRLGALVAKLAIPDVPAVPMLREFFLAEDGALYRMAPGVASVRFVRFEVRP
jgi:hypothetical protein